jgi:flavodoxin
MLIGLLFVSCNSERENDKKEVENISLNESSIVIYFSRTNNTEKIANYIIELTNSKSYEILAKIPYTDDDIKYYTDCRADKEQKDPNARVEIDGDKIDISNYSIIYLGYPIWHGDAPKIMYTFVESYDLKDKTIIPFCTSASSGIGNSGINLSKLTGEGKWLDGKRFDKNDDKSVVSDWLNKIKETK